MNNWCVITGAFASGKTTLLAALARNGYEILPEAARTLIDEGLARGQTVEEIRQNEAEFQRRVLQRKIENERRLVRFEYIFLDRGLPDTLAYLRMIGADESEAVEPCRQAVYKQIFILDPLPFTPDYARIEKREQIARLDGLLESTYRELGHEMIRVPVMPTRDRMKMVLESLDRD